LPNITQKILAHYSRFVTFVKKTTMNQDLRVTLLQSDLFWENCTANLAMFEEKIATLSQPTDLIVLPEMFNTGFTMQPERLAEPAGLTTHRWLKLMAAQTNAVVTGSYPVSEGGQYFNRLVWMRPNGTFNTYDKRHLFRMGKEHEHYASGTKKIIETINGWRICPTICYDLRFPVWSRNLHVDYDILINVANWPAIRSHHWNTLLAARAIENQAYVIAVNRVGEDGHGTLHAGDSQVIDFKGNVLYKASHIEDIHCHTFSKNTLDQYRQSFPAYLDADDFEVKL
jgi:omega-amidase